MYFVLLTSKLIKDYFFILTSKIEDLNVSSYTLRQMFASSQINKYYVTILLFCGMYTYLPG